MLQTRIARWTGSTVATVAVSVSALRFALIHLPYAWLQPAFSPP